MKKKQTLGIVLGSFLIFVSVIAYFNFTDEPQKNKIHFNQDRVFNKALLLEKSYPMDKSYAIMKKKNNHFYFVSWGKGQIYKFNQSDLTLHSTYGNLGEGQKENLLISRYTLDSNYYSTIDTKKRTIQMVTYTDSLLYYHKFTKPYLRSVKVNKEYLFVSFNSDFNFEFEKFNLDNKQTTPVKINYPKLKNIKQTGLVYDGFFVQNKTDVLFVSYSNDVVFCFNNKLENTSSFNMVYDLPNPVYEKLSDGNLYPSADNYNCTEHAFLSDNGFLYILTSNTVSDSKKRIVDVYNTSNKTYAYSFSVPSIKNTHAKELIVENNTAYVLYDGYFAKYQIK